jgi:hypothetical protein
LRHLANGGEPYLLSGVCKSADILAVCTAIEQAEAECDTIAGNARELHVECQSWEESTRSVHLQLADAMKRVNELDAILCECSMSGTVPPLSDGCRSNALAVYRTRRDAAVIRWAGDYLLETQGARHRALVCGINELCRAMASAVERGEVVIP